MTRVCVIGGGSAYMPGIVGQETVGPGGFAMALRSIPILAGLVAQVADHAGLAAEAAVTGDRALPVRALLAHPLVRSLDVAERLVDAYLGAHARHVPPRS